MSKRTLKRCYVEESNLDGGAGLDDIFCSLALVLLEVLDEELAELENLLVEALSSSGPGSCRVQQLRGHTRACLGDLQVEDTVVLVLHLGELTRVNSVEDGTSILQGATLTTLGSTGTDPTGVEQPGTGRVCLNLVCQHLRVAHGVQSQERLGEARGEGGLGLEDTILSTGHLGGVARNEVEHDLLAAQLGDRRQNTAGVASEEDDVAGVARGHARNLRVLDVLNGVGASSVLGQGRVIVVDNTRIGVENDILEDGTVLDSTEDIRLLLGGETNALGIATTLDVEHAVITPAVLVVTNQLAVGVGRECGLASTGQTEEQGDIALLTLVGGGVQGKHVVLDGHFVEENSEDTLLHLTGVLSTQDNHLLIGEIEGDGCARSHTLRELVGRERTGVVDSVVGVEVLQLLTGRADKHVAHKQSMVGAGTDNSHANSVPLVPASVTINNVDTTPRVEVVDCTLAVDLPNLYEENHVSANQMPRVSNPITGADGAERICHASLWRVGFGCE